MKQKYPVLYTFRRCPYAIRARLAIAESNQIVELREVVLRNKPQHMLEISAKATVPILLLNDGKILDESLDIMDWALADHNHYNQVKSSGDTAIKLIQWNDGEFKYYLDRYKYADRYPEYEETYYRKKAELFLIDLEKRLSQHHYLCGNKYSIADMAIFPFIRQFANVNIDWFNSSGYKNVCLWLKLQLESSLFVSIMDKYCPWEAGNKTLLFNIK